MRFPRYIHKTAPQTAPVSGAESLLDYHAGWTGGYERRRPDAPHRRAHGACHQRLCPCSKNILDYGAQNKRSHVTSRAELGAIDFPFDGFARIAEEEASSELYGLLKRADEKFITERAYDNPKFVKDVA